MTTVDRYFARRILGSLFRSLVAFVCIYILIDLLTHRDLDIVRFEVPWHMVVSFYAAFTPQIIFQVAPFALLIAALLVLGDSAQNNEITAMLAGGVSLRRLVRVPILLALFFFVALVALQESVGAAAVSRATQIERDYFSRNPDLGREGISWANLSSGWTCHITKFNRIALTGEGVSMHRHTESEADQIEARRIYWDDDAQAWFLEDGQWFTFTPDMLEMSTENIRQRVAPLKEKPEELFAMERSAATKTAAELAGDIAKAEARAVPTSAMQVDLYAKFAQPALSFIMIFIAIPFAVRLRRGGLAVSFATSILIAVAYLVLFSVFVSLGQAGRISPLAAAWAPNALFLFTGLVLFWRTPT